MDDDEPTGLEGAGSMYIRQGTREDSCLICGRSSAEQRIAPYLTPGGLRLLLCEICTSRWQKNYGLTVTTPAESGLSRPLLAEADLHPGSPVAAAVETPGQLG